MSPISIGVPWGSQGDSSPGSGANHVTYPEPVSTLLSPSHRHLFRKVTLRDSPGNAGTKGSPISVNTVVLGENSLYVSYVPACFKQKHSLPLFWIIFSKRLYNELSWKIRKILHLEQRLVSLQPWKTEIASPSRAKGSHAYCLL